MMPSYNSGGVTSIILNIKLNKNMEFGVATDIYMAKKKADSFW